VSRARCISIFAARNLITPNSRLGSASHAGEWRHYVEACARLPLCSEFWVSRMPRHICLVCEECSFATPCAYQNGFIFFHTHSFSKISFALSAQHKRFLTFRRRPAAAAATKGQGTEKFPLRRSSSSAPKRCVLGRRAFLNHGSKISRH